MARAALVAVGAVLVIGGGAAIGYGVTRKATGGLSPQAREAMTSSIAQLDGDVKAARATVKERAATLAALLPVQAAVSTDATTAKDMLERGELQFRPQPGEVIELGQIVPADPQKGGKPQALLIQPEGAMRSEYSGLASGYVEGMHGSYVELMDDKLLITEVATVTPKESSHIMAGYVTVSRPLDLKPSIDRLVAAGVRGAIRLGGKTREIGTPDPKATLQPMTVPSVPEIKLIVAVSPKTGGMFVPAVVGGGAVAAVGLILVVIGLATGRRAQPQELATPGTQPGTPKTGAALAATSVAAGTPSPVAESSSVISPSGLGPGAMIGRWEIIRRLGSGGMADVYLARARGDAGFEKTVAVKVMHPHLARIPRAVDHVLDEARLAALIHHPNVVAIQDLGKIGNDYVIVMEYVDGVDLDRLLSSARAAQRQVPLEVGLGILCRICDGLDAAHKAIAPDGKRLEIVHRDVKAANVLVSKQGGVKVVDFGIAKATQQAHQTIAGETKGTPSMMAPEQRVGEVVDVRADVYSVAAVAFEILTGQSVNLDLAALAHLGIENWPHLPAPSSLRAQLPPELDGLLLTAMSYERDKRPADCAALEAAFERVMKQYNLTASDKDIGRWVASELALMPANHPDATAATAMT